MAKFSACEQCRTSKTRCQTGDAVERNQDNLPSAVKCDQCFKSSRKCSFETDASDATVCRKPSFSAIRHGEDPNQSSRKRPKKHAPTAIGPKEKTYEDLLNPSLITPLLLESLWNIFEKYFLTDLPFLHKITFNKKLNEFYLSYPAVDSFTSVLLAFLALTTPLSDTFIQDLWPKFCGSCSIATEISKKYADASSTMLNTTGALASPALETMQTLLMIGLHEWRITLGRKAFLTIGTAVDCVKLLRVVPRETPLTVDPRPVKPMSPEERFFEEIRRRTFWSCYIMDSYVSGGSDHMWRIIDGDTKLVQLPCSEKDFMFGHNVRTLELNETDTEFQYRRNNYFRASSSCLGNGSNIMWQGENNLESLAWFIRALDVYRGVVEWACNVNRCNDPKAPCDKDSAFYKLDTRIDDLKQGLPTDLILGPRSTIGHIRSGTHRNYVLLHSIFSICDMALHSEYLPLYSFNSPYPEGPIESDKDHLQNPKNDEWWRTNAEKCFKAARGFLDLMDTCADNLVLVETPMTGFALFYVLQIILWCRFFPNMDGNSHLCAEGDEKVLIQHFNRAQKLMKLIQKRLPMKKHWTDYLFDYEELLKKGKRPWRISEQNNKSDSTTVSTGSRGLNVLDNWISFEPYLKEFGNY